MAIYKKTNDLRDLTSGASPDKSNDQLIRTKYLTLSDEITCLAGLLEASEDRRVAIIRDALVDDILQVLSHYKTDPVLLRAVCKFARQYFSRPEVINNPEEF
jgi:hypothetical protein